MVHLGWIVCLWPWICDHNFGVILNEWGGNKNWIDLIQK